MIKNMSVEQLFQRSVNAVIVTQQMWRNGISVLASIGFHLLTNMLLANGGVCVRFMFYMIPSTYILHFQGQTFYFSKEPSSSCIFTSVCEVTKHAC